MSECRICATTDALFLNIFQKYDTRKYDVEINTCLPIKVTLDDVISLKICHVCVHKLELCNAFVCHFLATEPRRHADGGQNLCYLCLQSEGVLSSLFDGNFNWIHQIETALGCKVLRGKRVPSKICHHCAYKLGELYNLCQSVLDSESKLYLMCEFPKANNQNRKFVAKDTKELKSSVKINKQPMTTKSPGSINNAVVRVATRKVNTTEARNDVSVGVRSNANTNVVKVVVAKVSKGGVRAVAVQHPDSIVVKGTEKQLGISHQVLEGRAKRKVFGTTKIQEEHKQKVISKGSKATLKPVDNIPVACWKCYRNLKNNETCSCSVSANGSTKTKQAEQKNGVNVALKDITTFDKTETAVRGVGGRNKRKIETEDSSDNNSKKVRGEAKKPVVKKRDVTPLVSHLYDIRRTKRKRTITDYNQFLNDGLLLSPKADKGKKDIKSVPKVTPSKETKMSASSKPTPTVSSRRNSRKSSDAKLENQENIPQKTKTSHVSKQRGGRECIVVDSRKASSKSAKSAKVSPRSRVQSKVPQEEVDAADGLDEPEPPEVLNKYECSVCNTQFPSTVEGKLHEVTHTARIMKLIMYRWADSRSSAPNSPSKQSQKSARRTENASDGIESRRVSKEIKKMLQDVVSKVSEESSSKVQKVNGHSVTRTRTGRIVVSKIHVSKNTGKKKTRSSNAEVLKGAETVRNIISDFESLEEGDEMATEPSLTTDVEPSGEPSTDTMKGDEYVRRTSSEKDSKQNHDAHKAAKSKTLVKKTEQDSVDISPETQVEAVNTESHSYDQDGESVSSNKSAVITLQKDSQENKNGEVEEFCGGSDKTNVVGRKQVAESEPDEGAQGSETLSIQKEGSDVGSASKDEESDKVGTRGDETLTEIISAYDVDDKTPGSSGSSVIVEEPSLPSNCVDLGDSSYDMHTSLEKEIYELHGVENIEMTLPKISGAVGTVVTHDISDGDNVPSVSNETDLIHILE